MLYFLFAILSAVIVGLFFQEKKRIITIASEARELRLSQIHNICRIFHPIIFNQYIIRARSNKNLWQDDVNFFISEVIFYYLSDFYPLTQEETHATIEQFIHNYQEINTTSACFREWDINFEASCLEKILSENRIDIVCKINQHIVTLSRKYSFHLNQIDDYGKTNPVGWVNDVEHFIKNVIFDELIDTRPYSREIIVKYITYLASSFKEEDTIPRSSMSATDYEEFCASSLRNLGWIDVRTTKATGDQGADIIAKKSSGELWVFQCKNYNNKVGNLAVQQVLGGMSFYKASHGAVITNSEYTKSAQQLALSSKVYLLHHTELNKI